MTKSGSSKSSESDAGSETGEWAKAVVDGMPETAGSSAPPPAAPLGNVTPDEQVTPDEVLDAVDAAAEADAHEAELADGEISEPELVDTAAETGPGANAGETGSDVAEPGMPDVNAAAAPKGGESISVEDLVIDLERVTTERDQYLDASRRLQAEFENYKKQVAKRESQARERANDSLISELLPVMDAFDGAVANGAEDVAPMRSSFLDALAKQGLERIDPGEDPFDPNLHEAVMHEDDAETDGPVVAEVMRAGYVWKGRVLRPAMVRTRG